MSEASISEGTLIYIGAGDATTVADASDVFTEIGEVVSFANLDGGESPDIDVTHMGSTAREFLVGLPDSGTFSMELNFVDGDAGQASARAARAARGLRNFRVILPDSGSTTFKFKGYPKGSPISGGVDAKIAMAMSVRITGPVTES